MDQTNWASNLIYRANAVHAPDSVQGVQELVARSPKIRALGTRHSFSDVADSPGGELVSVARLAPGIVIGRKFWNPFLDETAVRSEFAGDQSVEVGRIIKALEDTVMDTKVENQV